MNFNNINPNNSSLTLFNWNSASTGNRVTPPQPEATPPAQPVKNKIFPGQKKDLSQIDSNTDYRVTILRRNFIALYNDAKRNLNDGVPKMISFMSGYFARKQDKEVYFPILLKLNIFEFLHSDPRFEKLLSGLWLTDYIELSYMQNDDFESHSTIDYLIQKKIISASISAVGSELKRNWMHSNLALYLYNHGEIHKLDISIGVDNPLNLLRSTEEGPLSPVELAVIRQDIIRAYRTDSTFAPPNKEINPIFGSREFPENYVATIEFYLLFFNVTIDLTINIDSLYKTDSLGISYNTYLKQQPLVREKVLEKMHTTLPNYSLASSFGTPELKQVHGSGLEMNFYLRLADAVDDLEAGSTEKILSVLDSLSLYTTLKIPIAVLVGRALLSKIARSADLRLQEKVRTCPLHVFNNLYRRQEDIKQLSDYEVLNLIPIGEISKADDSLIIEFLETEVLEKLKPITRAFALRSDVLDASTIDRFTAFHKDMLFVKPILLHNKIGIVTVQGYFNNFMIFFPRQLFATKYERDMHSSGVHAITKKSVLYEQKMNAEATQGVEYRVTLVHYLCNRSKYTTTVAPQLLKYILADFKDALNWPDSSGKSVLDLAENHAELKQWLIRTKLIKESANSVRVPPQLTVEQPQPVVNANPGPVPVNSFIDYLQNLYRAETSPLADQNQLLKSMRSRLSLHIENFMSKNPGGKVSEVLLLKNGLVRIPGGSHMGYTIHNQITNQHVYLDFIHRLVLNDFAGINRIIDEKNLPCPHLFNPNSGLFNFIRDPLSDRQHREILGTIYQVKLAELHQFKNQKNWKSFHDLLLDHAKLSEMNTIPLLVIRQESDLFHAEIVVGRFTAAGHLIGVSPDRSGSMSSKVKEIAGSQVLLSGPDDEDRTAKITVDGMKLLTDYCKNEKGLNLLILPRLDIPYTEVSNIIAPPVFSLHTPVPRQPELRESEKGIKKRNPTPALPNPKRVRIEPALIDPEILPNAPVDALTENKGVQSIVGIGTGKRERDFDEMSEPKRLKSSTKKILPEEMYVPGASRKKQSQEALVADQNDPAAYLKNLAFMWIKPTVEKVSNIREVKTVLVDGLNLPIEAKLLGLPQTEDLFIFSSLYTYQYNDLKRIIQLQKTGISPLISYRMGLGKTYMYIEMLMQALASNILGIHMVVVPKSVLPQAAEDIKKGLINAKATAWRALWTQNLQLAQNTLKAVLNPIDGQSCDVSALFSLMPSLDLINDKDLRNSYLNKVLLHVKKIVPEQRLDWQNNLLQTVPFETLLPETIDNSSLEYVIAANHMAARPDQLGGFSRLIRFRSDSIVIVERKPQKGEKSLFVPGRIIVTKYHQVANLQQQDYDQLDSLTIDEAQKINRKSENAKVKTTGLHASVEALIRAQKKARFKPLVITGTPLENSPAELWTLHELVNPSLFPPASFNAFDAHVKAIEKQVVNIRKTRDFPTEDALKVFVEHYRLKIALKKSVIFLTRKEASATYGTKFPTAKKMELLVDFSEEESKQIDAMTRRFASKDKFNYFDFLAKINSILAHPSFVGKKLSIVSPEFGTLKQNITSENEENVDQVIQESSLLRTLFQSPAFTEIFTDKKKGLLILDNIAPGELIKLAANRKKGDYARFYNGKLSERERNELVQWFKKGNGEPRLLILSIEAGGVGLNLPEADLVIVASKSYNPWQIKQAIDRAFRSGHEGEKPVYQITYKDSFFSKHLELIRSIKKLWVKTLFRSQPTLKEEFALWMHARLAEAKRLAINNDKDMAEFQKKMEKLERKVNRIVARVSEEELSYMVEAALPQ